MGSHPEADHPQLATPRANHFLLVYWCFFLLQSSNIVEIEDIEPLVMESFLHYIYTGEISGVLDVQFSKDLLAAADKYEIEELKQYCEVFMSKNLSVENVSYIMVLAHLHGCTGSVRNLT
jgi:speckle-type POZ protein